MYMQYVRIQKIAKSQLRVRVICTADKLDFMKRITTKKRKIQGSDTFLSDKIFPKPDLDIRLGPLVGDMTYDKMTYDRMTIVSNLFSRGQRMLYTQFTNDGKMCFSTSQNNSIFPNDKSLITNERRLRSLEQRQIPKSAERVKKQEINI